PLDAVSAAPPHACRAAWRIWCSSLVGGARLPPRAGERARAVPHVGSDAPGDDRGDADATAARGDGADGIGSAGVPQRRGQRGDQQQPVTLRLLAQADQVADEDVDSERTPAVALDAGAVLAPVLGPEFPCDAGNGPIWL